MALPTPSIPPIPSVTPTPSGPPTPSVPPTPSITPTPSPTPVPSITPTPDPSATPTPTISGDATGLAPPNALESAILAPLPPGAYTAVLSDVNGATGLGLVEIYNVTVNP
ncbi:MAG: hypothetical protein ABI540_09690 [Spartobacteria bacterium]